MSPAAIDEAKCKPELCENGVCPLRGHCPTKAVWQPEPSEMPFIDWSRCRDCKKCISACPQQAVSIVR